MKNFVYGGLFLTLVFAGCKKEHVSIHSDQGDKESFNQNRLYNSIDSLNIVFKEKNSIVSKVDTKYWARVASADATGAWAGSRWGALFGNPWTTGIGAVVVGGLASYGAGITPIGGNDYFQENLPNFLIEAEISNENNNPNDISVGLRHNEILKEVILAGVYPAHLSTSEISSKINLTEQEINFLNTKLDKISEFQNSIYNNPALENMISNLNNILENDFEIQITNSFLNTASTFSDFDSYINYVKEFEYVIINSNIEEEGKDFYLKGIAVAKYSGLFWSTLLK